jgi:rhomboid protease GluP
MNELLRRLDAIPVTALVALAYVSLAFLTDPFEPATEQLIAFGAARGVEVGNGEGWRLISYAFLHGGTLHLLFNTWALVSIGPALERAIGSKSFAAIYLAGAVGGGVVAGLWNSPLVPLVGGSGALFGMLGAMLALTWKFGGHGGGGIRSQNGRQLLSMIAINLLIGFVVPMVSNAAHIGGLLAGFVAAWLGVRDARAERRRLAPAMLAALVFAAGLLLLTLHPVHRWDYHILAWNRAKTAAEREVHRRAFGLAIADNEDIVRDDDGMQREFDALQKSLAFDR